MSQNLDPYRQTCCIAFCNMFPFLHSCLKLGGGVGGEVPEDKKERRLLLKTCQRVNIIWKYTQTVHRQGGPWTDGISYGYWISLGGVGYRAPYGANNHYQADAWEMSRIHYTFYYNLWMPWFLESDGWEYWKGHSLII